MEDYADDESKSPLRLIKATSVNKVDNSGSIEIRFPVNPR